MGSTLAMHRTEIFSTPVGRVPRDPEAVSQFRGNDEFEVILWRPGLDPWRKYAGATRGLSRQVRSSIDGSVIFAIVLTLAMMAMFLYGLSIADFSEDLDYWAVVEGRAVLTAGVLLAVALILLVLGFARSWVSQPRAIQIWLSDTAADFSVRVEQDSSFASQILEALRSVQVSEARKAGLLSEDIIQEAHEMAWQSLGEKRVDDRSLAKLAGNLRELAGSVTKLDSELSEERSAKLTAEAEAIRRFRL